VHPVEIDSARLRLREFTPADVTGVLAIYGDPKATEHLSFEPRSREQIELMIANSMQSAVAEPRTEYALAAVTHETGELIGSARLALEPHSAGQIGFALNADHWGRGLGTELAGLLLELGFNSLQLHRIWAARSPVNTGSERVLTHVGMTEEGRIRHHVHSHGVWRDSITYGILEDEWRSLNTPRRVQS
jgi:ribosomal-protein-alanine N-acetyltransferase